MFISRNRRGPDRWLGLKIAAFGVGVVLFLAGVRLGSRALVWIAIGVLLVGYLLRLLPQRRTQREADERNGNGRE